MARVPVVGRLFWLVHKAFLAACVAEHIRREYLALLGSLILIFLEGIIRVITLGLRKCSHVHVNVNGVC